MKELIIKHKGWVRSDLLPGGWMFKQIAEGITKDNEWYATLHYLSDDGITFKIMKTSWDHMESLPIYSEVEVTDYQEFLREQKPILLEGSEDASGHGRSSRDANSTGGTTHIDRNKRDICLTTVKNESTLRNHLSTHVDKDNRDNGTVEFNDKEEELKVSELEQKLCESKNVLPHTALD